MSPRHRPGWPQVRVTSVDCAMLSVACLLSYGLVTLASAHVYSLSRADDQIGGLWAVISTVFVFRETYQHSVSIAVSRVAATLVSFAICLVYLIFLPSTGWSMAVLIGLSCLAITLLGRPDAAITAGISTAVVMVSAILGARHAWLMPILRLADTVVGVAVGVAAAWVTLRVLGPRLGITASPPPTMAGHPDQPGVP